MSLGECRNFTGNESRQIARVYHFQSEPLAGQTYHITVGNVMYLKGHTHMPVNSSLCALTPRRLACFRYGRDFSTVFSAFEFSNVFSLHDACIYAASVI